MCYCGITWDHEILLSASYRSWACASPCNVQGWVAFNAKHAEAKVVKQSCWFDAIKNSSVVFSVLPNLQIDAGKVSMSLYIVVIQTFSLSMDEILLFYLPAVSKVLTNFGKCMQVLPSTAAALNKFNSNLQTQAPGPFCRS